MRGKAALQMFFFTIRQCLKIYVNFFSSLSLSAHRGETFGTRAGGGWQDLPTDPPLLHK